MLSVDGTSLVAGAVTTYVSSVFAPARLNVQLTQTPGTVMSSCSAPVVGGSTSRVAERLVV